MLQVNFKMPNIKQPQRLETKALNQLGNWVAHIAESLMVPVAQLAQKDTCEAQSVLARNVNQIRLYMLYNVPWTLYNNLADEVIRALSELLDKTKKSLGFGGSMGKFVSQMNVAVSMVEVIFTKHFTILSLDSIPKIMRSIFYIKLKMLTGLVSLNLGSLSGGWKTADMEESILQSLKYLHCLKYLFINYDCTDNILKCVALNCPQLKKLDVSCSKSLTNDSIDIILKLKSLVSIQLYRTSVTLEGYAKLLVKNKIIEDIGRCDEIGRVLEYIDLTNFDARPLSLTTYVSKYAPISNLQLVVEMCPKIRSITVFHNTLQGDLMILTALPELLELKLLSCDFYADQIKQVLQVKGCNIISLHLEHVDQIDLNALMYISQLCPMLETFTLYNCTLIQHTSLYTKKLEILPFRNLKKFTCVATCTDEQLSFILSNCLNVDFIHIGTAVQLTDDFFAKILDTNPLIYLKELRIMKSDFLTIRSVERIIQSCMSLETLVELECWSMLLESDVEYIRNYIRVNNFNIDTSPIRRYDS